MNDFINTIKEVALRNPEKVSIIDEERRISYGQLWDLVDSISFNIHAINHLPRVVIDLDQSIEAYALILAILNIGGTYCPLNPLAPLDRKNQIINEFKPDCVVVKDKTKVMGLRGLLYDINELVVSDQGGRFQSGITYNHDDIIYVIYTSGSTGNPKGVQVTRKALNKFLDWSIRTYQVCDDDIWGQFSLLSFDLSIVDIFTCLCSGGSLLILSSPSSKIRPSSFIEREKITIWHSIPSAIDFMMKSEESGNFNYDSLRLMSFCGEPLKKHHVEFLFSKNTKLKIFNTYGPTEGTLFCTWKEFKSDNYEIYSDSTMSIGEPIPGWNVLLEDQEEYNEQEIVIYGDYISPGYLTGQANGGFGVKEIAGKSEKFFRTGDLVYKKDEELFFSCRKDRQIKLKGYRIEPAEIDYWLTKFINKPSVTVMKNGFLFSFIEGWTKEISENEIKNSLREKLESYKIPHSIFAIEELPRNTNLKIDMKALLVLIKS